MIVELAFPDNTIRYYSPIITVVVMVLLLIFPSHEVFWHICLNSPTPMLLFGNIDKKRASYFTVCVILPCSIQCDVSKFSLCSESLFSFDHNKRYHRWSSSGVWVRCLNFFQVLGPVWGRPDGPWKRVRLLVYFGPYCPKSLSFTLQSPLVSMPLPILSRLLL